MISDRPVSVRVWFWLATVVLAIALCASEGRPAFGQSPQRGHVPPLASAQELKRWLAGPRLRILDARTGRDYVRAHLPGAVLVDVDDWQRLSATERGLLDADAWGERIAGLGIAPDGRVVVYGSSWPAAARVWWLLRFQGVRDVRMLDGGWMAWRRAAGPIDNRPVTPDETAFSPQPQLAMLATKRQILQWLATGAVQIVDARSAAEYRQHIPTAIHIEWSRLIAADGRMLSPERLKTLFRQAGLDPAKPVVAYCRSGARASVMVAGLLRAGFRDVRNYYLSWNDWVDTPPGPIERAD